MAIHAFVATDERRRVDGSAAPSDYHDLESVRTLYKQSLHRAAELTARFTATLSPGQLKLFLEMDSECGNQSILEARCHLLAIASHFPGFREAIVCIADGIGEHQDHCQVCNAAEIGN